MPHFSRDSTRGGRRSREARGSFRADKLKKIKSQASGQLAVNKDLFHLTRVGEPAQNSPDGKSPLTELDVAESTHTDSSDDNETENDETDGISRLREKSYGTLLQNLIRSDTLEVNQGRKRKFEDAQAWSAPTTNQEGLDQPVDVEDIDTQSSGDAISQADETEDSGNPYVTHFAERQDGELGDLISKNESSSFKPQRHHIAPALICDFQPFGPVDKFREQRLDSFELNSTPFLKNRLRNAAWRSLPSLDRWASHVAFTIFNYKDCFCPLRSLQNCQTLRTLVCLHALNHVFQTRAKIIRNNAHRARETVTRDNEFRDQGFTRPKVLMLLPTRNSCAKYIEQIMLLCQPEQQKNRNRFSDSYLNGTDLLSKDKPADFQELFAGNDDDMFRLGLKFTRKAVKYFSPFYNSDIILASPLGLRMALGPGGHRKQDHDFLSSIEILVFDQADAVMMQNWEHIEYIFQHLNMLPKEAHGCDFSRIKNWYLDGHARYLRQTIIFSAFTFPSLNKLCNSNMLNIGGKFRYAKAENGVLTDLRVCPKQTFCRFNCTQPSLEPEERLKYFTNVIVPSLIRVCKPASGIAQGILIYLPTYADFVRVRNFLANSSATQDISFGSISEYTPVKDVARARSHFLSGRHTLLLYTERAHHFRRYHLTGVKKIIMYGLPENAGFYKDIVEGFIASSINSAKLDIREATVRALFSRLDVLKLERIVGSIRYISMLGEQAGDTFDFV